jgi:hypothetical protein
MVRRLLVWFWHELSQFLTVVDRGQLMWAHGQLETLRRSCVSLALVVRDPDDPNAACDPYLKADQAYPSELERHMRDRLASGGSSA